MDFRNARKLNYYDEHGHLAQYIAWVHDGKRQWTQVIGRVEIDPDDLEDVVLDGCPNCGCWWGVEEMDWEQCDACGWPNVDPQYMADGWDD